MSIVIAVCRNCPFWQHKDVQAGECRAESPRVFPMTQRVRNPISGTEEVSPGAAGMFPPTSADGWCGKHPLRAASASWIAMSKQSEPLPPPAEEQANGKPRLVT